MGLLNRLFGTKPPVSIPVSNTELMSEDTFWKIIEDTFENAEGDYEEQQEELRKYLSTISIDDVIRFDNRFRQLRGNAYHWDLWGAIYIIHGGCGDDSFNDFRGWLICQGKELYETVVNDPKALIDLDPDRIDVDWEGAGYIANTVYEERVGKPMPTGFQERYEIMGEEWDEEGDDLRQRFPSLWQRYSKD